MIDPSVSNSCTIQRRDGEFCNNPADPRLPHPVCGHHALRIYEAVKSLAVAPPARENDRRVAGTCTVYYLRVGTLIKIGRTTSLARRLKGYPPDAELLASEDGPVPLERRRLKQFNEYLEHGNEWFTPGTRLMAHIAALASDAESDQHKQRNRKAR